MVQAGSEQLSALSSSWLRANCQCAACLDPVSGQRLVAITDRLYGHEGEYPADWLKAAVEGTVVEVATSFGYVRETNYGKIFNIKVVPDPANLAYSARAIGPHTDNSLQPLRPGPAEDPAAFAARADEFYQAYRAFAELLIRPDLMLTFRLGPGDCLVFDNTRIMHARTAFTGAGFADVGDRHLQGCYADLDGVASALAVLDRPIQKENR
jgi:Taurine catabolism dioxygenase TauD, TfdA family